MTTVRLADLHPEFIYYVDSEYATLIFDCPTCKGGKVAIKCWNKAPDEKRRIFSIDGLWLFNPSRNWDSVTVIPSIGNEGVGRHGLKKPPCRAHITLSQGRIILT